MKRKYLNTLVAALALATGIGTVATTGTANAASHSIYSSYWNKNRKVKVKKTTTFRKFDALKRKYVKGKKTYKKGKVITVRAAGEFTGWVLAGTKAGSRYWWISKKGSTSWMTEYKKPKKPVKIYDAGFKGNTYTATDGSKLTFDKITNFDLYRKIYNGSIVPTGDQAALLQVTFTNKGKAITPKKFMNREMIEVYSGSSVGKYSLDLDGYARSFEYEKEYKEDAKTFGYTFDKGETATFYVQVTPNILVPKLTDTYTIKGFTTDGEKETYTLKALETKNIVSYVD